MSAVGHILGHISHLFWTFIHEHIKYYQPCIELKYVIVSEHCREEGCFGLYMYIPDDQEISQGPRDVPGAKPEGHLEGRGKSQGRRGGATQYIPPLGSVRPFSHH